MAIEASASSRCLVHAVRVCANTFALSEVVGSGGLLVNGKHIISSEWRSNERLGRGTWIMVLLVPSNQWRRYKPSPTIVGECRDDTYAGEMKIPYVSKARDVQYE